MIDILIYIYIFGLRFKLPNSSCLHREMIHGHILIVKPFWISHYQWKGLARNGFEDGIEGLQCRENVESLHWKCSSTGVKVFTPIKKSLVLCFPSSHGHSLKKLAQKNSTESEDCTVQKVFFQNLLFSLYYLNVTILVQ